MTQVDVAFNAAACAPAAAGAAKLGRGNDGPGVAQSPRSTGLGEVSVNGMPQLTGLAEIYYGCVFPSTLGVEGAGLVRFAPENAHDRHAKREVRACAGVPDVIRYRSCAARESPRRSVRPVAGRASIFATKMGLLVRH